MAGEQNNPLDFADDKIREIEKKIQEKNKNLGPQKQEEIFARINGLPTPEHASSTLENIPSEKIARAENISPIKNLRTFQGDVADAIKKQNASVLTIALAEKKKQEGARIETLKNTPNPASTPVAKPVIKSPPANPELKKNILMVALSIILITLGAGSVFGFYVLQKREATPITNSPQNTILGWSKKETLSINGLKPEELVDAIYKKRQIEGVGVGEILFLELVQTSDSQISAQDLFTTMKSRAPASLIRSFGNQLMFGFFNSEGSNQPFLIIRLESFDRAFDGMLSWEKTMFEDIGALFTRNILPVKESLPLEGNASGTRILSIGTPSLQFDDEAIRNKDARILKNTQGETILLYSFLDKETLLITSDERVLQELVNKLVAQKLIR